MLLDCGPWRRQRQGPTDVVGSESDMPARELGRFEDLHAGFQMELRAAPHVLRVLCQVSGVLYQLAPPVAHQHNVDWRELAVRRLKLLVQVRQPARHIRRRREQQGLPVERAAAHRRHRRRRHARHLHASLCCAGGGCVAQYGVERGGGALGKQREVSKRVRHQRQHRQERRVPHVAQLLQLGGEVVTCDPKRDIEGDPPFARAYRDEREVRGELLASRGPPGS